MPNRDYFTRPTQAGGRTAHDYGHTKLSAAEYPSRASGIFLFLRWGVPRALCLIGALYVSAMLLHAFTV